MVPGLNGSLFMGVMILVFKWPKNHDWTNSHPYQYCPWSPSKRLMCGKHKPMRNSAAWIMLTGTLVFKLA